MRGNKRGRSSWSRHDTRVDGQLVVCHVFRVYTTCRSTQNRSHTRRRGAQPGPGPFVFCSGNELLMKQRRVFVQFSSPLLDGIWDHGTLIAPYGHGVMLRLKASLRQRGIPVGSILMWNDYGWEMEITLLKQRFQLLIQLWDPYELGIYEHTAAWVRWWIKDLISVERVARTVSELIVTDGIGTNVAVKTEDVVFRGLFGT